RPARPRVRSVTPVTGDVHSISHRARRHARSLGAMALAVALIAAACSGDDDAGTGGLDRPATSAPSGSGSSTVSASTPLPTTPEATSPVSTGGDGTGDGPTLVTLAPEAPLGGTGAEPVRGGTLRFGMGSEVDGLNPTSSALTTAPGLEMA